MNGDKLLSKALLGTVIGTVLSGLVLGLLFLALAGSDGLVNGLILGGALGLIGSLLSVGLFDQPFWYEIVRRVGEKRHRQ